MSPKTPDADPLFQAVKSRAQLAAKVNKIHQPARTKAAQVDDAAVSPPEETQGHANARHMDELALQKPASFDKGAFKAAVRHKLADAAPKNLEQADNFKSDNNLGDVKKQAASDVKQGSEQSAGPLQQKNKETPSTSGLRQKSVKPLLPEAAGGPASNLGARGAAPKPRKDAEISLQAGPQQIQKQLADHQVTEPQLQRSNEPKFLAAVDAKQAAQMDADAGPAKFRPVEQGALAAAGASTEAMAMQATQAMKGGRDVATRQVLSQQEMAKGKDEQARSQVAAKIQSIFDDSKQKVQNRLTKLDSDVNDAFDKGADAARKDFEGYVGKRMDDYKDDRYSGFFGPAKWAWDKLFGMPDEVNAFYEEGRDRFLQAMDGTLDQVATMVEVGLNEATALVASGRKQVQSYVDSLPQSLHQLGQDAQSSIEDQFQSLEQSIQDKQDELVDGLAQKYNEQVQQLDERINELKEENKGLVQKAIEFIVDVVKTLVEMGALLVKILIRAAGIVWKILKDPIGFLRNLISGAKNGFDRFTKNIAKHLQRGLVQWLTGELGGAGLQLPDTFDAKGVFTLVLQVLGLSYEGIRARLVRHFGEGTTQAIEEGVDIIRKAKAGGVGALWEEIKDQLGNLKDQVLGDIQQYVQTQVIQAGVMWVVNLFSPASAFVQACKAIYRIVQFFVEKAAQVAALVDAVLDSVEAVANGDVGAMASKIEDALAKAIPVVIGLLANALGISGIAQKVKSILHKVRAPIEKAIDAVLKKAAGLVKQAGKRVGDKVKGHDKGQGKDSQDRDISAPGGMQHDEIAVPKTLIQPNPVALKHLSPAVAQQIAAAPKSVVLHHDNADPKAATKRVLADHQDSRFDPARAELTLPAMDEGGFAQAQSLEKLGSLVAAQTGVRRVTLRKEAKQFHIEAQINPKSIVATGASEDESDYETTKEMYRKAIDENLKRGLDALDVSSDSEAAVGSDLKRARKRRQYKLGQLKAVLRTRKPVSLDDKKQIDELQQLRQDSYADRPKKRRRLNTEAQEGYDKLAEKLKDNSFLHNPYLRRSARGALTKEQAQTGGPNAYKNQQAKIRECLKEVIQKDYEKEGWRESEFSDLEDYLALRFATKNKMSNDKKKTSLHTRLSNGQSTDDASPYMEFHHVGFKESKGMQKHALNPANLVALHGERERNDSTKQSDRPGMHEYMHQLTGYKETKADAWHGRGNGGRFVNMDYESVSRVTKVLGQPRTAKKDLYGGYDSDDEASDDELNE